MAIAKRMFLFITVNFLVLIMLSLVMNFLGPMIGIHPSNGTRWLLLYSVVFGFGGAFISLMMSKWLAKMRVQVIDPNTNNFQLRSLVNRVHMMAQKAGLSVMPEVAVYESPEINAFATGPSRNNSLVAVSTGLLNRMNDDEVDGVLAHEVAHIANGDMVTMTLVQGVINAMVIFLARMVAGVISGNKDGERSSGFGHYMTIMALEMAFSLPGMMVVNYVSRMREYRADAGGADLAGNHKMVRALKALQNNYHPEEHNGDEAVATLKISGKQGGFFKALFSTHPDLSDRIARLEARARSPRIS
jgi:heat shock protein HtpX